MRRALPVIIVAVVVGVIALFAWRSVDRRPEAPVAEGPLAWAPADTPYLLGMAEPFPADVLEDWWRRSEPLAELYALQFEALAEAAGREGATEAVRIIDALRAEFAGKGPREAMAVLGLDGSGRMALYGVGLVPVLRAELADPEAFRAFVARMEQHAGQPLPRAELDGRAYWRIALGEARVDALVAELDGHLVATLAPAGAEPAVLRVLLGLELPPASAAAQLANVSGRLGFLPQMSGYLDSGRLLAALTREPTPIEAAFLAALEVERPQLEPACRDEYAALAVNFPRVAFGYTALAADHMAMDTVVETSEAIAQDLMELRAPMPGMALVDADTPANVGLSFKLGAVPGLVNRHAAAIEAAPYQCPSLAWLNESAAQARAQVNNPALFAAVPVFSGFHLVLETLRFSDSGEPSAATGTLVIGSQSPQALVGMAGNFLPQLAQLQLAPDGKVHPLPLEGVPNAELAGPAHVAMGEHVLGIAFGQGQEARLPQALESDPEQQPLLVFGYGGELYRQFAAMSTRIAEASGDAQAREHAGRNARIMEAIAERWLQRVETRVEFEPHGIVLRQTMLLP